MDRATAPRDPTRRHRARLVLQERRGSSALDFALTPRSGRAAWLTRPLAATVCLAHPLAVSLMERDSVPRRTMQGSD
jgi:hypothetical protein